MLHRADSVTIARGLSVTRYFEKGEQAVVAHIEKIVAHAFVRRIASVVRSGPETFGHLHRMDVRHADDVGIEFNLRFHVVRAQRSEESRVGTECVSTSKLRGWRYHKK